MAVRILNFTTTPSSFRPSINFRPGNGRANSLRLSAAKSSETPPAPADVTFSPPPDFKPPEPKVFAVQPDKQSDIIGASLALFLRFGYGVFVSGYSVNFIPKNEFPPGKYGLEVGDFKLKETSNNLGPRPEKPIEIYEFESCPFCRKVREIVAILDLDVLYYPCPKDGPNFRPKVAEMGGKKQFPYMVDPNTKIAMYESDEIIKYLVEKYGDGKVPVLLSLGLLTTLTAGFAMMGRTGKGSSYTPAKSPPEPLEIWAYEASPFCKVVRETLVELELPHILRSCARGSPKRQILYEKVGHFQAPYLEDPNTGIQMFESADIVEYLKATYTL
ncbi:OLC1v1005838C1 [Oldenlandia corymbosa var. corymbosa]|uniref:OLC1v1005838C1 n=1 Tax=Oldenlandia corymbosa var. corymbosa TaxID=529605 RepID=A0AAV1DHW9_OLDCO|nr:OLC1v1005838C1 [Oldenlandia corymbosa var. corymbosa]